MREIIARDSENSRIGFIQDDQGDLIIFDPDNRFRGFKVRFCGPGGDGCYALKTKRAIQILMDTMEAEIAECQLVGEAETRKQDG